MSDERRDAKAEAAAAKARAKSLRPWYKKKRFLLPLAFVLLIVIIAAAGGGDDTDVATTDNGSEDRPATRSGNTENPPTQDVAIERCAVDDVLDLPEAGGTITNNSSAPSNYVIHVEFLQDGRRVAEGFDAHNEVAPGQQVNWEATGTPQARGAIECRITRVERYAA